MKIRVLFLSFILAANAMLAMDLKNPVKVEYDLIGVFPEDVWGVILDFIRQDACQLDTDDVPSDDPAECATRLESKIQDIKENMYPLKKVCKSLAKMNEGLLFKNLAQQLHMRLDERGTNLMDYVSNINKLTLLHWAVIDDKPMLVEFLLYAAGDNKLELLMKKGTIVGTALHGAFNGEMKTPKILLRAAGNDMLALLHATDNLGKTPCQRVNRQEAVHLLQNLEQALIAGENEMVNQLLQLSPAVQVALDSYANNTFEACSYINNITPIDIVIVGSAIIGWGQTNSWPEFFLYVSQPILIKILLMRMLSPH